MKDEKREDFSTKYFPLFYCWPAHILSMLHIWSLALDRLILLYCALGDSFFLCGTSGWETDGCYIFRIKMSAASCFFHLVWCDVSVQLGIWAGYGKWLFIPILFFFGIWAVTVQKLIIILSIVKFALPSQKVEVPHKFHFQECVLWCVHM